MKAKFLSGLALLALVTTLTGCTPDKPKSSATGESRTETSKSEATSGASEKEEYTDPKALKNEYDVVIVGAGGAGLTAAISAKEAGANPVILEKMPIAGGNTLKASAGMNASETKVEEANGIQDSNDLFYEETLKGGGGTNNKELLRYFVDNSASAIDWLDQHGIVLNNLTTTGGMSVSRTHRPSDGSAVGGYLVNGLLENVGKLKIPIFVNADVTKIHTDKSGKVDGVEVTVKDTEKHTIQSKAVVVTTGGFGSNKEMIEKYKPELKGYVSTNHAGATGDGIQMIENLGGAVVDMEQIQIHPTVEQENAYLVSEAVRGEGAILVSSNGERFFNEMETRDKVSAAINALDEKSAYLIFDQGVRDRAKAIDTYVKKGFVIEGKTMAELAKKADLPEKNLEETVNTWNQAVTEKKDTLGRTTAMDNKLEKGPFYAIKIAPGIHHTMGGVVINTQTEVLKKDGKAIPGLYAAGEVTGGLHGGNRIGGNAVADIVIFGRQAGNVSAKYVEK
ncbi:MAG: flavocytochrome c [Lactobacillales bacterium]|jgi:fumarate reductase flavoprotein subunit|nr:flavocytochrome c [Lactobacillales bacterium]